MTDNILNNKEILNIARDSIVKAMVERFTSAYNSPLSKIIDECVSENYAELKTSVNDMLLGSIHTEAFKKTLKEEFIHKVAKNLVSNLEGAVARAVDTIKQDPIIKSKMIIALENIINNHTNEHN